MANMERRDGEAGLFASLFLQDTEVMQLPRGGYDAQQQLYVEPESGAAVLAKGEKTTCWKSCGMTNTSTEWCAATNSQGECTNWITKMDFESIYDEQSDWL